MTLTGQIEAKDQVSLSFRIGGRMNERLVNVGDRVKVGRIIARLESETARNTLRSAQADLNPPTCKLDAKTQLECGKRC